MLSLFDVAVQELMIMTGSGYQFLLVVDQLRTRVFVRNFRRISVNGRLLCT
jgi:hypothetical protein